MDGRMKLSVVTVTFGALGSPDRAAESRGRRAGRAGHLNARTLNCITYHRRGAGANVCGTERRFIIHDDSNERLPVEP
jgi:hypothetical protein